MSSYRDYDRDRDDAVPPQPATAPPFDGVAVGAGLQATAHILYVGSVLFTVFIMLVGVSGSGMRGDPGPMIVLLFLAGMGLIVNWVLSVVGSAILAAADSRPKARGVALAMLAFGFMVLLQLPDLSRLGMFGPRGGPFGGGFGDPMDRAHTNSALGFLFLLELARVSLSG
ncbi:MAG: hypothetical protein K2W96_19035 [Gemmataceae bacterium]|nr:hypothetical protein [Gemmataceae bacterium]